MFTYTLKDYFTQEHIKLFCFKVFEAVLSVDVVEEYRVVG
jgi:hypothetical protein